MLHPDIKMKHPEKSTVLPDIVMSYLIIIISYTDSVIAHFDIIMYYGVKHATDKADPCDPPHTPYISNIVRFFSQFTFKNNITH